MKKKTINVQGPNTIHHKCSINDLNENSNTNENINIRRAIRPVPTELDINIPEYNIKLNYSTTDVSRPTNQQENTKPSPKT